MKQALHITRDLLAADLASIIRKQAIRIGQNSDQSSAGVPPFINQLLEDAGVGMLGNETCPEHFDALTSNLFHNRRIVHEPPAAERHEVVELSGVHAQLVLVLAAQHADQKTIVRVVAANILQRTQVGASDCISRQTNSRIDLTPHSDHQRQWNIEFATRRQHRFTKNAAVNRVVGKLKGVRKRHRHVNRTHSRVPIG